MGSVILMVEVVLVVLPGSWNCARHSLRTFSSNPCSSSQVAMSIRPVLQRREQGHEELENTAEPDLDILVPKSVCRVSLCRLGNKGLVPLSDHRLSGGSLTLICWEKKMPRCSFTHKRGSSRLEARRTGLCPWGHLLTFLRDRRSPGDPLSLHLSRGHRGKQGRTES